MVINMDDLLQKVKKLALEKTKEIKDKEIYLSPKFKRHIQSLVGSVLIGRKKKPILTIDYNTDASATVGCTNGNNIYINAGNHISNTYNLQENRMLALFGIVFHECAHILFLDFDKEKRIHNDLLNEGGFYGAFETISEEEKSIADEIIKTAKEEKKRPIFVKFYDKLSNVFSDVHDESKICHKFRGVVERGITLSVEAMRSLSVSIEKLTEKYSTNPTPVDALKIMMSLILQFARYREFVIEDDEKIASTNEFLLKVGELSNTIVVGSTTDDLEEKYAAINKCLMVLWPYIKEILDKADNSAETSEVDTVEAAVESILKSIDSASEEALPGESETPKELEATSKTLPKKESKTIDDKSAEEMVKSIIENR